MPFFGDSGHWGICKGSMVEGIDATCLSYLLTILGRKHGQVDNSITLHKLR